MTWYSQAGQDEWVRSIIGDKGFFVDVGAHDGVTHSNTYALEWLGWDGVCVEPDDGPFKELFQNRACLTSSAAMSDHKGDVTIMPSGRTVPSWTLMGLLEMACAPSVIDYLSIDTEGHELEVLAGMDFERWRVRLITIEHNLYRDGPAHKDAIFDRLSTLGFERVIEDVIAPGFGPFEDWFRNANSD